MSLALSFYVCVSFYLSLSLYVCVSVFVFVLRLRCVDCERCLGKQLSDRLYEKESR